MKRLLAAAALLAACLLVSTPTQAQYIFEYGGRTIRIDPDRGTVSIPGVYDNTGRRRRPHGDRDSDHARRPVPDQAKVDPQVPTPARTEQAPASSVAPANTAPLPESTMPESTTANVAPADTAAPPAVNTPTPPVQMPRRPYLQRPSRPSRRLRRLASSRLQPCRRTRRSASGSPRKRKARSASSPAATIFAAIRSMLKSNVNGEQVLINMKPGKDQMERPDLRSQYRQQLRFHDGDEGQGYSAGAGLRFRRMFAGGQTWTRLN